VRSIVSVVAAIVAGDPETVPDTLAAIERQVYGPRRVVVVGRDAELRAFADASSVGWSASLDIVLESAAPGTSHIWILRAGAVPRPDALRALVEDSERAGSALAGSKILNKEAPEQLVSVGVATDVFAVPYLGLDEGEVDAGQYDVVRDVAAVDGASVLVRRDLARGLGGFDRLLAPQAAAVDLSQRARLRAARVVVVPSSEVEYRPADRAAPSWREEAGYIRSMLKSYSLLTLSWVIPLMVLVGLIEAVVAPFVGRWTLFTGIRAWLWNLLHLFSTLKGRHAARRGEVVNDAEFYRYQVRGSVRLKRLVEDVGARLTRRLGPEERSTLVDLSRDLRRPAFVAGFFALLFVVLATRSVWSNGFPASGYSLPLPASGADALGAYAGGWNPGGFGSAEPLPPLIGLAGALQVVLFDSATLTTAFLILGAFLAGIWGTTRLLRTWDVGPIAGILAGVALMAGPAARSLAADTGVGTLLGLSVLPWAMRVALMRWPGSWRERAGRIASMAWVVAVLALLSPPLLVVPAAALLLWALLNFTDRGAWRAAAVGAFGSLPALPVLLPWLDTVDLAAYLDRGSAYWTPGIILAITLGVAFVATVVSVPARLALVAGWGGTLVAAGGSLARSGDFGPGREVEHLGIAVAAAGTALVVGTAIEGVRRVVEITGWRRMLIGVGAAAATVVAGSSLLVVVPGRAGLPAPELSDRIGFVVAAEGDPSASRILLIGDQDLLPGESRTVRGAGYRVVSAPIPEMWEAWLPPMADIDVALQADLEAMIDGDTFRAGEVLAPYGIRWIISVGDTPLEAVFGSQLDLVPLGTRRGVAFTVEGDPPVRATADDGTPWARTSAGYDGEPDSGRVFLAETSDSRWGPDGQVMGPGVSISAADGEARFSPIDSRRSQVMLAGAVLLLLMALAWLGRLRA
jgi:GT2 family glycosyltransferase